MRAANSNESRITANWKGSERYDLHLPAMNGPFPGPEVLSDLRSIQTSFQNTQGHAPKWMTIHLERQPDCGSGLHFLAQCIEARDHSALCDHANNFLDAICDNLTGQSADILTIAVIDGHADGASFSIALSCDFIVARRGSTCSLPNFHAGLPLSVGTEQMLQRHAGAEEALRFINAHKAIPVERLSDAGIITLLFEGNDDPVDALLSRPGMSHSSLNSTKKAMRKACPLENLRDGIGDWVEDAMTINPSKVRKLREGQLARALSTLHG